MPFKHTDSYLLDRVSSQELSMSELEEIMQREEEIEDATRNAINYLRDMAAMANQHGLSEEYAAFGGYGVFAHLVNEHGNSVIDLWRGSDDVDLVGKERMLNSIRDLYAVHDEHNNTNIDDKITLVLSTSDCSEQQCKLDFTLTELGNIDAEEIDILGVPVMVVSPEYLLKSKISLHDQAKHQKDLGGLLSVTECRGISANELLSSLGWKGRRSMRDFLQNYQRDSRRLALDPSQDYVDSLRDVVEDMDDY